MPSMMFLLYLSSNNWWVVGVVVLILMIPWERMHHNFDANAMAIPQHHHDRIFTSYNCDMSYSDNAGNHNCLKESMSCIMIRLSNKNRDRTSNNICFCEKVNDQWQSCHVMIFCSHCHPPLIIISINVHCYNTQQCWFPIAPSICNCPNIFVLFWNML